MFKSCFLAIFLMMSFWVYSQDDIVYIYEPNYELQSVIHEGDTSSTYKSYSNSEFSIDWFFVSQGFRFHFINLSDHTISILWDQCSMYLQGNTHRTRAGSMSMVDLHKPITPTSIMASGKLYDLLYPSYLDYFEVHDYGTFHTRDDIFFGPMEKESLQRALRMYDYDKVYILLVLESNREKAEYLFIFKDTNEINIKPIKRR